MATQVVKDVNEGAIQRTIVPRGKKRSLTLSNSDTPVAEPAAKMVTYRRSYRYIKRMETAISPCAAIDLQSRFCGFLSMGVTVSDVEADCRIGR